MQLMKRADIEVHMRTITKNLSMRLEAQAQEADLVGLKKVAGHLNKQVDSNKTRPSDESYVYASKDLSADVEGQLWNAVVRIADYYNCNVDAELAQKEIEKLAGDLVKAIGRQGGVRHGVGAYEPTVPGEMTGRVAFEVVAQSGFGDEKYNPSAGAKPMAGGKPNKELIDLDSRLRQYAKATDVSVSGDRKNGFAIAVNSEALSAAKALMARAYPGVKYTVSVLGYTSDGPPDEENFPLYGDPRDSYDEEAGSGWYPSPAGAGGAPPTPPRTK